MEVGLISASDEMEVDQVCEILKLANRSDLTQDAQGQLAALLRKWERVFSAHEEDFGRTDVVQHCIPTGDADPIRERFRPLPPFLYQEIRSLLAVPALGRLPLLL